MTADQPSDQEPKTSGHRVRPPIMFAFAILLGLGLDHLLPIPIRLPRDDGWLHRLLPALTILCGIGVFAAGVRGFSRAGTPVPGSRAVRALVTTGIHNWSRNPIYVGMILIYTGVGIALRSTWIIALLPAIILILRYAVISREEAYLKRRFGNRYREYRARVRRWL